MWPETENALGELTQAQDAPPELVHFRALQGLGHAIQIHAARRAAFCVCHSLAGLASGGEEAEAIAAEALGEDQLQQQQQGDLPEGEEQQQQLNGSNGDIVAAAAASEVANNAADVADAAAPAEDKPSTEGSENTGTPTTEESN